MSSFTAIFATPKLKPANTHRELGCRRYL